MTINRNIETDFNRRRKPTGFLPKGICGIIILSISLLLMGPGWSSAAEGIENRQEQQQDRIEAGRYMGEITGRESIHLYSEQQKIEAARDRFLSDGELNRFESRRLHRMQNEASRNIFRAFGNREHDFDRFPDRDRFRRPPRFHRDRQH